MSSIELIPQASSSAAPVSLYQQSVSLIERLYSISGFEPYLFPDGLSGFFDGTITPDPVSILWNCFRLGAPLCHLLNQSEPSSMLVVPDVSGFSGVYSNLQKKPIYHFIVACKQELLIPDEDIFSISEMYKDDMNGFVKIMKTVSLVTEIVYSRSSITTRPLPFNMGSSSASDEKPTDTRSKVIAELLDTERKYVVHLGELQNYMNEIKSQQILNKTQVEELFANLPELLDFQRRFILALESTLAQAPEEQRIGQLFLQHEQAFYVYEPFCGNYKTATKIALQEKDKLAALTHLIEPTYGLQSYLIKPVQRVCKYPLLLKELIKYSDPETYPYMSELQEGMEAVKRVTERVNEQKRLEENREVKEELVDQIVDLKNLNMDDFGDLLLHDKFPMVSNQVEREYTLFLFQRIMLCCKDVIKKKKKKGGKEDAPSYSLKGNIYITSIGGVVDTSKPEQQLFGLQVFWKDGTEMETFALNCRNIEQVRLWMDRLEKLVELERNRRKSSVSNPRNRMTFGEDEEEVEIDSAYSSGVSPVRGRRKSDAFENPDAASQASSSNHPAGMARSRSQGRTADYPARSQWENNPPPPMLPEEYRSRKSSPAAPRSNAPVEFPPRGQSRPQSEQHSRSSQNEYSRGLAQRPPQMEYEAMMNNLSAMSSGGSQREAPRSRRTNGERAYSRTPQVAPQQVVSPQEYDYIPYQQPQQRHHYSSRSDPYASSSDRADPYAVMDSYSSSDAPPSRFSAAEERMAARRLQQQQQQIQNTQSPRLQQHQETYQPRRRSNRESNPRSSNEPHERSYRGSNEPAERSYRGSNEPAERSYRGSNEPAERVDRGDAELRLAARMQQLRTSNGPPARAPPSPSVGGSMIKVKTHYGSDIFVVAVSSQGCSHAELYEKIERKIRLCGAELPEGRGLKMRYRDISGDLIVLGGDDDVEAAFDVARISTGRDSGVVNLFIQ